MVAAEPLANSEKLLKCSVEVGGGEVRQVVAGLQPYVAVDALRGSLVCVILNLKPAKLAGEKSEAMILAADTPAPGGGIIVRVLQPPGACVRLLVPRRPPLPPARPLARIDGRTDDSPLLLPAPPFPQPARARATRFSQRARRRRPPTPRS